MIYGSIKGTKYCCRNHMTVKLANRVTWTEEGYAKDQGYTKCASCAAIDKIEAQIDADVEATARKELCDELAAESAANKAEMVSNNAKIAAKRLIAENKYSDVGYVCNCAICTKAREVAEETDFPSMDEAVKDWSNFYNGSIYLRIRKFFKTTLREIRELLGGIFNG